MHHRTLRLTICVAVLSSSAGAQTVMGSGTTGKIPKFTGASTLGDSPIWVSGTNVGIGTTGSVVVPLQVVAPASTVPVLINADSAGGRGLRVGTSDYVINATSGSTLTLDMGAGSGSTYGLVNAWTSGRNVAGNLVLESNGGNVGIGTTQPDSSLQLNSASTFATVQSFSNTSAGGHEWLFLTAGSANKGGAGTFQIYDATANVSRLFFDTSGNAGFGVITPQYTLDVNGTFHASGGVTFPDGTVQNTAFTPAGNIALGGNLGIGTTTPTLPLTVMSTSGSASFTESGNLHVNSTVPALTATTGSNNAGYGGGTAISAISRASDWGGAQNGYALYAAAPYDGTNASGYTYADRTVGLYVDDLYSFAGKNSTATFGIFAAGGQQNYFAGSVGIGTSNPAQKLEVAGYIQTDAGIYFSGYSTPQTVPYTGVTCGGDYAESVDVAGDRKSYEPGDVLVIGAEKGSDVLKSADAYSTLVAGIYSTKPGLVGRRQTTDAKTSTTEVPMAMVGIVPTKVSAENGSIKRGDLLVTSSTLGYAMKGTDRSRMLGAVVGKALGNLDSGIGVIEVLVTLQ